MSEDIHNILSSVPIDTYISRFISLKRKGKNLWGLCPFHNEKTPSFSVAPDKGIFKCFGCGKGGNVLTFVQEYERISFPEALKLLAEQAGITLTRYAKKSASKEKYELLYKVNAWVENLYINQINDPKIQGYLQKRDIDIKMQKEFNLGFSTSKYRFLEVHLENENSSEDFKDKEKILNSLYELGLVVKGAQNTHRETSSYNRFRERLIFPINNEKGKTIGFGGRIIEEKQDTAKYVNSPESKLFHKKRSLYNIHRAKSSIRENKLAILVEGYFDVVGLYQKNIHNVIAPLGTAFTEEQASLIKRFTDNLVIFFDNDNAGYEAAMKALIVAKNKKIITRIVLYEESSKDPFDLSLEKDQIELLTLIDSAREEPDFVLWYYFSYKYPKESLKNLEEKKTAILDFFSYLKENVEHLFEQLEFIKLASIFLDISTETLEHDFKKYLEKSEGYLTRPQTNQQLKNPITKKTSKIEKDILALLLYFPDYWENEFLLDQVKWSGEDIYLLFSFFRDRLKSGEIWKWENLCEVISLIPNNLAALLSEIIFEFDHVIANQKEEKDYSLSLKKMILQNKLNEIEEQITEVKKRLSSQERSQEQFKEKEGESLDELTIEFQTLILEKKKVVNAFRK